jgi:hypothetical protein
LIVICYSVTELRALARARSIKCASANDDLVLFVWVKRPRNTPIIKRGIPFQKEEKKMTTRQRFFGVMLLMIAMLLVTVLPASAATSRTPFTGRCGFLEEPPSPDVRLWYPDQNVIQMRNELQSLSCDFSDDRLDGIYTFEINWDAKYYTDPFWYIIGHDYGKVTMFDQNGNLLWEGNRNTFYTGIWVFDGQVVLHGRGIYAGLMVKADIFGDFKVDHAPYLSGEIYE